MREQARFCDACGAPVELEGEAVPPREPRSYTPPHLANRILTSRSALEGERKQVTVLFADVKGSTELAARLGPERWHRTLDRLFQILAEGVHRFEGTINQFTGDGIMALFGAPVAHEDHAVRACHAALSVVDALGRADLPDDLALRLGLNSGDVIVGKIGDDLRMDYTAQGQVVAVAARIEEIAEPGHVWISGETARLVDGLMALAPLGSRPLRGIDEPVEVFEVAGGGLQRTRLEAAVARGLSQLVGRHGELIRLEGARERAVAGDGRVVGVVGEPGVGKSRLCLEFAERCESAGVRVIRASCPSHTARVPYTAARALVRAHFGLAENTRAEEARDRIERHVADWRGDTEAIVLGALELLGIDDDAELGDSETRDHRLRELMRRLIQARSTDEPAVLVLDDAHWIDRESDGLLGALVEALGWTRTTLVVNYRPEYRADWMDLPYFERLDLRPLPVGAVGELLDELLGDDPSLVALRDQIVERAQGNPFFIEEAVRELDRSEALSGGRGAYTLGRPISAVGLPATVEAMLAARIDRLDETGKYVLATAACLGSPFGVDLLERVVEMPEADLGPALSGLEASEFIRADAAGSFVFGHPLIQEVAYRAQLGRRRADAHRAAAVALEELHAEQLGLKASLIAHHWDSAGVSWEARRWHMRAALRVSNIHVRRRHGPT